MSDTLINTAEIWCSNVIALGTGQDEYPRIRTHFNELGWDEGHNRAEPMPQGFLFNMNRLARGQTLEVSDFPSAVAIYDEEIFERCGEFMFFSGFPAVAGEMKSVLSQLDFGKAGGLVPLNVYGSDCKTKLSRQFYFLNFGAHFSDSFLPAKSKGVEQIISMHPNAPETWVVNNAGYQITLSQDAINAPDIWVEPKLKNLIFFKKSIVDSFVSNRLYPDLCFHPCLLAGGEK